ncbi:ABC transporter substrate-binding protein [uncultured Roseibium sp.]|uniref:ABC transporter substrate-binding protein n=1 Tax=uncultured Roseibium sp. TaxID=1936171 RepID=UPI0032173573
MKRTILTMLAAAALTLSAGASMAAEKVTFLFPAPDFLPAFAPYQLALHKGYFKEAGLDVSFRVGKGGADVATQVAVGNADLGGGVGDTPIIVRSNDVKIRGVALLGGHGIAQLAWREDSGITGPSDLKGKEIGILSFQQTTYYNLLGLLAAEGLTKQDVSIQALGPGGVVQMMIAGKVQAIAAAPEIIAAVEQAGVKIGQVPVDSVFPAMAQAILASDDTIAKRPEMVRAFVGAILHAVRDIEADPAAAAKEFVAAVPRHAGKEAEIEAILTAYATKLYPTENGLALGAFNPERIASVQKFYVDSGIVQSAVPVEDLYTNSFVQ